MNNEILKNFHLYALRREKKLNPVTQLYFNLFGFPVLGKHLRLKILLPMIKSDLKKINSALDVGCGLGEFSLLLAGENRHVIAIDASSKTLNILADYSKSQSFDIKTQLCDLNHNLEISRKFDAVLCIAVLDYLKDPEKFLKTTASLVNPGGVYYLGIPLKTRKTYLPYEKIADARTLHQGFDINWLQKTMGREGWRIVFVKKYLPFNLFYHMSKSIFFLTKLGISYENAMALLYPLFLGLASVCQLIFPSIGTEAIIKFEKNNGKQ